MTTTELLKELESMLRQTEDAANSCQAAADYHRPEFKRNVNLAAPDTTEAMHDRALELYGHVINNDHEARRLRKEEAVLSKAIRLIREQDNG